MKLLVFRPRTYRPGFTLVEVALAVAVGLIVIGGAVLGYNSVKDNVNNANARQRVMFAYAIVEEYASANGGRYPVSKQVNGTFQQLWAAKRPEDKANNPWGGPTGDPVDGAVEVDACDFSAGSREAAMSLTETMPTLLGAPLDAVSAANAGNLSYVSATSTENPWACVREDSSKSIKAVKNFVVGICGKDGTPYWSIAPTH